MSVKILVRQGTAEEWTISDPVLAQGEFGLENDTGNIKLGDGATSWNELDYYFIGTIGWDNVTGKPTSFIPVSHTHNIYEVGLSNLTNDAQLKRAGNDFSVFTQKVDVHADDIVLIEDSETEYTKKWATVQQLAIQPAVVWEYEGALIATQLMRKEIRSVCTIREVYVSLRVSPLGDNVEVQIYKVSNPYSVPVVTQSIFVSDAVISIAPGEYIATGNLDSSQIELNVGDILIASITNVGTDVAGYDLSVNVNFK
jgi:hypothetical protein